MGDHELAGRRIIVTGAASGMGKAIATLFARHGARQFLMDVNAIGLDALSLPTATTACVDLADPEQVETAVKQASDAMGGIDGIVNVAGILRMKPFADTDRALFRHVVEVNLFGPYYVCFAALPYLQAETRATIVNFSSLGALIPPKGMSAYAAAKAGLLGFSRVLAHELGPRIRVNAIAPGVIDTPMTAGLIPGRPDSVSKQPLNLALDRPGTPEEVAELALFLAGDRSSFLTGTTIAIDGGSSWH